MDRVVLTTGGTGGHIFPALAVAEELRVRYPQCEILFIGSEHGPEAALARKAAVRFEGLPVKGILGRGRKAFGAAWDMLRSVRQARRILQEFRPQVVAGFGGYAGFAPVFAARTLGLPTVLHEQNAIGGFANKVLGRLVDRVCVSLPDTQGFPQHKCVLTGNPVRKAIVPSPGICDRKHLLVMGGSQGAKALNTFVIEALAHFVEAGVQIVHQTGHADFQRVQDAYRAAGMPCGSGILGAHPFIDDMGQIYQWADLVLCRAGASSVAELAVAGKSSVLVPFPYATHDHQTRNAQVMSAAGAAVLIQEKDFRAVDGAGLALRLLQDPETLQSMGRAAASQGHPQAAAVLVDCLTELAGETHA